MTWIVLVLAVIAAAACVAWFVGARRHPEQAATHAGEPRPDVARRPAGPGAENMAADEPGGSTPPGPSTGTGPV